MAESLYILTFNPFAENPTHSQVDIFLRSHRDISTWYFPHLGTYLFKSGKSVAELTPGFRQFFGNTQFVMSFVIPALVGGSLPENIWAWINQQETQSLGGPL